MVKASRAKRKTGETVVICICGLAGSGKSTLAKRLARRYRLRYCSGGDALKSMAIDEGYKNVGRGWWESEEGMRFLEERRKDPEFDEAIDRKLMEQARKGNVILDSWTMPWLVERGFKIWLEASPEKRAERIAKRDRLSVGEALLALKSKEMRTKSIFEKLYGFRLGENFRPFQFVLDTDNLEAGQVFQVLCLVIDNCLYQLQNH